jgi:signal transduction histidine kinase
MKSRGWLVLLAGFGVLILLIALLGFGAMRRAQTLDAETASALESYLRNDALLRDIPADLYMGGILIRDYLLDPSHITAPAYREQLLTRQASVSHRLSLLAQQLRDNEAASLRQFRGELQAYWDSMDPILDWSPQEKASLSQVFLRKQVLPRRRAVVTLARQISQINAADLRGKQQNLHASQNQFQAFLRKMVFLALSLGLFVAAMSIVRVVYLERRSEDQRGRAERAEEELRRLSRKLVRTQEEERRALSRELHDAIGQMLSAMTMELGNVESAVASSPEKLRERLNEARRLNADTIRGVRDLAAGLRPAMLDELGLGPALRWQGREFSRRSGTTVTVQIDGELDGLPESHRTCIYRVVQEALTNCSRHAQAKSIRILIYGGNEWVQLSIQDDGIGFNPREAQASGLGLIGIQERVRELDGKVTVTSQPRKGTILKVEVPVTGGVAAR